MIKIMKQQQEQQQNLEESLFEWFFLLKKNNYSSPSSNGVYKILNCNIIKFKESANFNSNTAMIKRSHINRFKLFKKDRGVHCPIFVLENEPSERLNRLPRVIVKWKLGFKLRQFGSKSNVVSTRLCCLSSCASLLKYFQ